MNVLWFVPFQDIFAEKLRIFTFSIGSSNGMVSSAISVKSSLLFSPSSFTVSKYSFSFPRSILPILILNNKFFFTALPNGISVVLMKDLVFSRSFLSLDILA